MTVALEPRYLDDLRDIVGRHIDTAVWRPVIFGSRASGKAARFSDIDLGFIGKRPLPLSLQARLSEALEDSDIPYIVDIVDLAAASPDFRQLAARHMEQLL